MKKVMVVLMLLFAFIGIADSAYIARSEATGSPIICTISGLSGCNEVAASPYSKLFGIPLADYGVAFYGIVFMLSAVELAYGQLQVRRFLQTLAALGLIASAYFVFLQAEIIRALCEYCILSALLTLLMFIAAYFLEPFSRKEAPPPTGLPT